MNVKTKKLTQSALIAALSSALLILSAVLPTGRLAVVAIAGLCMTVAVINCGAFYAAGAFAVSGVIGLLLSPVKGCAVAYLLFLGWYPIVKSPIEHIKSRTAEMMVKLLVFNAALAASYFAAVSLLMNDLNLSIESRLPGALMWLAANVVFVLYDFGLTQLIMAYLKKFNKFQP